MTDVAIGPGCTPGPEPMGRVLHRMDGGASIEESAWRVIHPPTFVKRADNKDTHAPSASSSDSNTVATVRDGHTIHTTAADGTDRSSPSAGVRSHEVVVLHIISRAAQSEQQTEHLVSPGTGSRYKGESLARKACARTRLT